MIAAAGFKKRKSDKDFGADALILVFFQELDRGGDEFLDLRTFGCDAGAGGGRDGQSDRA